MIAARMGWGAVLGLVLLQACASGDDEMTSSNTDASMSGGTGGGGTGGADATVSTGERRRVARRGAT